MSFFFCYVSISWDTLYVLPQTKQAVTQFIGRKKEKKKKAILYKFIYYSLTVHFQSMGA